MKNIDLDQELSRGMTNLAVTCEKVGRPIEFRGRDEYGRYRNEDGSTRWGGGLAGAVAVGAGGLALRSKLDGPSGHMAKGTARIRHGANLLRGDMDTARVGAARAIGAVGDVGRKAGTAASGFTKAAMGRGKIGRQALMSGIRRLLRR
jgi:hypothetical protein